MSTIFVNLRWNIYLFQMKDNNVYMIVGLLMALSFFLVRTLPLPYVWVRGCVLVWWRQEYAIAAKLFQCLLVTILCTLNTFWSYKIYQGIAKFFFAKAELKKTIQP